MDLDFGEMYMTALTIRHANWSEVEQDARQIRTAVFIEEQNIAAEDEWDAEDAVALHFMMYDQENAIATARLLSNHYIGRVAVLKAYRNQGVGRLLMQNIIEQARVEQRAFLKLSAQVYAVPFYESLGFIVQGNEYLDCGIPHINMCLTLAAM